MKNKIFTTIVLVVASIICLFNMKLELENIKLKEEIKELKGEIQIDERI